MNPCILLMWSGGVGSTCALLHLLTDSAYKDFDIIVHHVHIRNRNNKAIAEAQACKGVIEYIQDKKKYRQFFFSESNHEFNFMTEKSYPRLPSDIDLVSFTAANMCIANKAIRYVIYGSTETDFTELNTYQAEFDRAQTILATTVSLDEKDMNVDIELPLNEHTRAQVLDDLVKPVRSKVFSCESPSYTDEMEAIPCGKCRKCAL